MPQPYIGIIELFSGRVTEPPKRQLVEADGAHPKVRREQPRTSTSPKVATVQAPKATSPSVPRHASKKADTQPKLDAKKQQQLFQEFLEWRRRQRDLP